MRPVEEHFRFDDRDHACFLTDACILCQKIRIRFEALVSGDAISDKDGRAPFGELCPHPGVLGKSDRKIVEAFGHFFFGKSRKRHQAFIYLDTDNDTLILQDLRHRDSARRILAYSLVKEDDTRKTLFYARRRKQELAPLPTHFLRLGNPQLLKAFAVSAFTLIGSYYSLFSCQKFFGDFL